MKLIIAQSYLICLWLFLKISLAFKTSNVAYSYSLFDGRQTNVFDPFYLDIWAPFSFFTSSIYVNVPLQVQHAKPFGATFKFNGRKSMRATRTSGRRRWELRLKKAAFSKWREEWQIAHWHCIERKQPEVPLYVQVAMKNAWNRLRLVWRMEYSLLWLFLKRRMRRSQRPRPLRSLAKQDVLQPWSFCLKLIHEEEVWFVCVSVFVKAWKCKT